MIYQKAIQSVTIGGTELAHPLSPHLLSLAVALNYGCPVFSGQPTGGPYSSSCLVELLQEHTTALPSTIAYIPDHSDVVDYNLVVPSGEFDVVVLVSPDPNPIPGGPWGSFLVTIVLDDLGQPLTS